MRRTLLLALPALFLLWAGCTDQPTSLDIETIASFKKPPKPPPPVPAPAKPEISFSGSSKGKNSLIVMDADGSNATAIYTTSFISHSSWSDQGNGTDEDPFVILVSQSGAAYQPLDKLEIVADGGAPEVTAITTLSEDVYHHAVVRPGGEDFAAVHFDEQGVGHLVLGDMVSGDTIILHHVGVERQLWQPAWNVGGSKLAFFEGERDPPRLVDVRIIDMTLPAEDPGRMQTALSFEWLSWSPQNLSWARTANELILDLELLLYRIDLDAGTPSLGDPVRNGRMATWSPDDSKIVFQDDGRIWIGDSSGGSAMKLARGSRPDWKR